MLQVVYALYLRLGWVFKISPHFPNSIMGNPGRVPASILKDAALLCRASRSDVFQEGLKRLAPNRYASESTRTASSATKRGMGYDDSIPRR